MLKPSLKEARDGLGGELDNGRVHHRLQVGVVRRGVHCPLPGKAVVSEVVVEAGDAVAGVARLGVDEGHDGQNAAELGARVGALDQVKDVLGEGVEEGVELLGVKLPQLCRDVRVELPAKKGGAIRYWKRKKNDCLKLYLAARCRSSSFLDLRSETILLMKAA